MEMRNRVFIAASFLLGLCIIAFIALRSSSALPQRLPIPNGYDTFVRAGRSLVFVRFASTGTRGPSVADLQRFVSANTNGYQLFNEGLQQACRVPTTNDSTFARGHAFDQGELTRVAQALKMRGELEEATNSVARAADDYFSIVLFGKKLQSGGTITDDFTATEIQREGISSLEVLIPKLDRAQIVKFIDQLQRVKVEAEPFSELLKREHELERAQSGNQTYLGYYLRQAFKAKTAFPFQAGEKRVEATHVNAENRCSKLLIDLASKLFEIDRGRKPQSASELVPAYFNQLPTIDTNGAKDM